jgi:hypothetical protein
MVYNNIGASSQMVVFQPVETQVINNFDIKQKINGIFAELKTLLRQYGDDKEDLVIDGKIIPTAQKNDPATALLLDNKIQEIQQQNQTLLDIFNMGIKMEQEIGKF